MAVSRGIIVSTHGKFAEGILSTVKMIAGEFENVRAINFLDEDNYETLGEKYRVAFEELKAYEEFVIITDIMGGTPFNLAAMNYGNKENVRILSGLNFASLFTAIAGEGDDLDEFIEEVLNAGRASIEIFSTPDDSNEEDNFADGI